MAAPKRRLSPAEYLANERASETKSEYFNGEMFAMAGASLDHNRINENLSVAFGTALRGGPCFALSRDMRVKVEASGLYTYPDVVVICGEPLLEDSKRDTILNPRTLVEVLSPSTEKYDRGAKFRNYRLIPSLQEVVFVSQDEAVCERYVRGPDDEWRLTTFTGLDSELELTSVPVRIPLRDIYAGVTIPPPVVGESSMQGIGK